MPSGTITGSTITLTGANSDLVMFTEFLDQGGHLFLQGENEGFRDRNENLIQFLQEMTGATIGYPMANETHTWNTFSAAAPENLSTDFNLSLIHI